MFQFSVKNRVLRYKVGGLTPKRAVVTADSCSRPVQTDRLSHASLNCFCLQLVLFLWSSEDWCVSFDCGNCSFCSSGSLTRKDRSGGEKQQSSPRHTETDTPRFQNCAGRSHGWNLCFPTPVEASIGVTKLDGGGCGLTFGYLCREVFLPGLTSNSLIY